jgi:hypothetical protein
MSSSIEMKNVCVDMSVTTLLLKTLENATREYARGCVYKCASLYGFDSNEALTALNLENLAIQVREMKKRSSGKKTKAEKTEKPVKEKTVKVVKEKVVKEVVAKAYKPSIPLPFVDSMVKEDGCQGLAFNGGLFTQCQKIRMSQGSYCKGCQSEADFNANGAPNNGSVEQRLGCFMMDFRDSKGRAPIAYSKIMEKSKLTREQVELEAGKLNIVIDDVHFVVVEKKAEAGRPKAAKKTVTVVESATIEDLFAQLVDEDSEDETATILISSSEEEEELDTRPLEKGERDMMKEADLESKKTEKAIKNAEKEAQRITAKEQRIADELALRETKKMQMEDEKAQKLIDAKQAKEAKIAADLLAKEQKIAAELATKTAKAQKLIDDALAKEEKKLQLEEEKAQKLIDAKQAKEAKIAADLAAKEKRIADELVAKEEKAQKLINDKLAKEAKIAADLVAKEQRIADELVAKEQKKLQLEQDKAAKDQKKANELAAKEQRIANEKAAKETQSSKKIQQQSKAEPKVAAVKPVEEPAAVSKTKVTVKRITIEGKQYLKTAENLLYDPETKEEMGIYDPVTNTIKELPDDDEDEVQEDGYNSE